MSCVYCVYYEGLDRKCRKGTMIKNLSESFNCPDYRYDGKVTYDE